MSINKWKLHLSRFVVMLALPLAILFGINYFGLNLDQRWQLGIAIGVTWLMDQLGSFACFYSGVALGGKVERLFFPLNLLASIPTWWGLRAGWWSQTIMWRGLLVAGLASVFCVAQYLDAIYDTFVSVRPKIDWKHAFCWNSSCKQRQTVQKTAKVTVQPEVEAVPNDPPRGRDPTEEAAPAPAKVPEQDQETTEILEFLRRPDTPPQSTLPRQYRVCRFDELTQSFDKIAVADEAVPVELEFGLNADESDAPEPVCKPAKILEMPSMSRVDEIAEEISDNLAAADFEPEVARSTVQDNIQATVREATAETTASAAMQARMARKVVWARRRSGLAQSFLAIVVGLLLGVTGVRLGISVMSPLVRANLVQAILVFGLMLAGVAMIIELGLRLVVTPASQNRWLVAATIILFASGLGVYYALTNWQFMTINLPYVGWLTHPVDLTALGLALVYLLSLAIGAKCRRSYQRAAEAMEAVTATTADNEPSLRDNTASRSWTASLRCLWTRHAA